MKPEFALQPLVASDISETALEDALIALDLDPISRPVSVVLVVSKHDMCTAGKVIATLNSLEGFSGKVRVDQTYEQYEWCLIHMNGGKSYWSPGA